MIVTGTSRTVAPKPVAVIAFCARYPEARALETLNSESLITSSDEAAGLAVVEAGCANAAEAAENSAMTFRTGCFMV